MVKHIRNLVFDLDDTLYPKELEMEVNFTQKMLKFFEEEMNLVVTDIHAQLDEWRAKHGSDIAAIASMGFDPDYFMNYVCDIDVSKVAHNSKLVEQLSALPHKKIIYTNSTHGHVKDVFNRLKISHLFDDIFTIKEADFKLKPDATAYSKLFKQNNINPKETAMFEDNVKNLKTAKDFGMTTILISDENLEYPFVDYVFKNINDALDIFEN